MKSLLALFFGLTLLLVAQPAYASVTSVCTSTTAISCTGTLDTPEDFFAEPFTLTSASSVTIQTYGFGGTAVGYTNAVGNTISGGGFDSLVALFSGSGSSDKVSDLTILTDAGNVVASVAGTTQFFPGCPPAAANAVIGCGDSTLSEYLMAGTYTLLLSDANYVPYAVSPGPPQCSTLFDSNCAPYFADLSPTGSPSSTVHFFQTCDSNGDCITDTGNFAVDITGLPGAVTPEPGTLGLYASGLTLMGFVICKRRLFQPR